MGKPQKERRKKMIRDDQVKMKDNENWKKKCAESAYSTFLCVLKLKRRNWIKVKGLEKGIGNISNYLWGKR